MRYLSSYYLAKLLALTSFVAIIAASYKDPIFSIIFAVLPAIIVFLLATKDGYGSKLKALCRFSTALLVTLLCAIILISIEDDAQAGIGIMFLVAMQYGVIFTAEAIIGLSFPVDEEKPL